MRSSLARAGFDWEPQPDEHPVRFAAETTSAPGSEEMLPPPAFGVRPLGRDGVAILARRRIRGSSSRSLQGDVRTSLSPGAKSVLAGACVCVFCIGWFWGASVGSTNAAAFQAPGAPRFVAVARVAIRFEEV